MPAEPTSPPEALPVSREELEARLARAEAALLAYSRGESPERAGIALRDNEETLRLMLESMGDGVIATDTSGRVVRMNPAAEHLTGWSEREARGLDSHVVLTLLDQDSRQPLVNPVMRVIEGAELVHPTGRALLVSKDGTSRPIAKNTAAMRDPLGQLTGVVMVLRDASQERAALEALRRSQENLAHAYRLARVASWEWDMVRDRVVISADVLRILPTAASLDGRTYVDFLQSVHAEDRQRVDAALQAALAGHKPYDAIFRISPHGKERVVHAAGDTIVENGRPARLVGTIQDITEQQALQARLALADRMASVGTLAAGVAHEINNPLAYVIANTGYGIDSVRRAAAVRDSPLLQEALEALESACEGCERIRVIVRDMKVFSRPDDETTGPVDVRRAIESALTMAGVEIRHRANLVRDYHDIPLVAANESRLCQVFLNLAVNAAQAITEGAADRNEIRISTRVDSRGWAVIEIRDTGSGIPHDVLPRIFDPFFTTKPVGVGTGLGLSICHGIVENIGGDIAVESAPGKGSLFRVSLPPTMDAPAAAVPANAAAPSATARRGRIFVIDDEPSLTAAIRRVLSAEHDVVTFQRAREALVRLQAHERCDAILCDLMMPEMTGMELHAELVRTRPEVVNRMVFLTGGAFTTPGREFLAKISNACIEKPFDPGTLSTVVRALLSGVRSSGGHRAVAVE